MRVFVLDVCETSTGQMSRRKLDLWVSSSEERSGLNINLAVFGIWLVLKAIECGRSSSAREKMIRQTSKSLHNIEIRQRRSIQK